MIHHEQVYERSLMYQHGPTWSRALVARGSLHVVDPWTGPLAMLAALYRNMPAVGGIRSGGRAARAVARQEVERLYWGAEINTLTAGGPSEMQSAHNSLWTALHGARPTWWNVWSALRDTKARVVVVDVPGLLVAGAPHDGGWWYGDCPITRQVLGEVMAGLSVGGAQVVAYDYEQGIPTPGPARESTPADLDQLEGLVSAHLDLIAADYGTQR